MSELIKINLTETAKSIRTIITNYTAGTAV
jgi:hypothetical protein